MSKIIRTIYDAIIAHAQRDSPNECCGLLAGEASSGQITQSYPIANLASDDPRIIDLQIPTDRRVRYMMDPTEQFDAIRDMRACGLTMMGIYHSHPHSVAYPSSTDVRLAFYSDLFYFIVSLEKDAPDLRVFRIVEGEITEDRLKIVL